MRADNTAKPNNLFVYMLLYGHFAGTPFIQPRLPTYDSDGPAWAPFGSGGAASPSAARCVYVYVYIYIYNINSTYKYVT